MAKIRRVVRKASSPAGHYFDEQLWPIYIALVVLGCFLMGISAAYLPLGGVWWYVSLIGIPLFVAAAMFAFRVVDNRLVRRSLQLSIVLCAILHVAFIVQMVQTRIFAGMFQRPTRERELLERRPLKIVPEYRESQLVPEEDRPRQDFEKPVETQTPEPTREPEQIVRQPMPEDVSPQQPQPVPIPEQERTIEPNVVKQQRANEVAPRLAAQTSQLSKQSRPSESKQSQPVELPQAVRQPSPGMEARPTTAAVARQETTPAVTSRAAEPTTTSDSRTPQLARRTDQQSPTPETSATPTLPRAVATPAATPRTQIATADTPSPSRRTSPTELTPAHTPATRQATTSPQLAQRSAEPTPQPSAEPAATQQRRQSPAADQPTVAAAPNPTPNRQPRETTRPDVATAAATPNNTPVASSTSAVEATPRASITRRSAAAEVTAAQPANVPATDPLVAPRDQPAARVSRLDSQPSPAATASPTATPTLTRQAAAPSLPAAARVAEAPAATATASAAAEASPSSTATRRQATASPQAAPAAGEPRPQAVASAATATATPVPLSRATSGSAAANAPVAANDAAVPTASRSTQSAVANVVTRVGDVPTNAGPQSAAASSLGPSSASISRQTAANSPAATQTQPAAAVAAASRSDSPASGGLPRAEVAALPTLDPSGQPGTSPRRALTAATSSSSPTAADSPASAVANSASADPTAQPSRVALSRSQAGTAGAGRSPNLDSSMPGGASPALVASGAARRAEATQKAPTGDALSPSAPAQIARSRSGADLPTATVKAEAVETASVAGGSQVAEVTASSSAALSRSDAAAKSDAITAAKGSGEVDLGPTQVVAEAGMGRASGGGQANPSFQSPSSTLARQPSPGGSPQMALAAADLGAVAAPAGTSGGAPAASEASPAALAASRTNTASDSGGGPSAAKEAGPLTEANAAALLADSPLSRADSADGPAGGAAAAGVPSLEDEEEKARRLARAALGGAPQVAVGGPVLADLAVSPMGASGDGGAPATEGIRATQIATARQSRDGGAAAGGPSTAASAPEAGGASGGEAASPLAIARAEAADGAPGDPAAGGGTSSPARQATGPAFAASTQAEQVALAGAAASGGTPDGAPLAARGLEASRLAGGAVGPATTGPIGAAAGPEIADAPRAATAGDTAGRRQVAAAAADGPAVGNAVAVAAPGRQASATAPTGGSTNVADIPEVGPTSAVAQAELDHQMGGIGQTPMSRQSGEALAVEIRAPDGPGGLGTQFTPEVGINTRQARADSVNVQLRSARFLRSQVGGLPAVSTTAIVASEAFSSRGARARGDNPAGGRGAPSPQTEEAIERGLSFLARYQTPTGGWSLQGFPEGAQLVSDTAATALAVIAFQGAGYNHREFQYKDVVRGGIDFLVQSQKENGDLFVPLDDESNRSVWLYSHSLAAIALCEAYGMTHDPALKEPAQKALDFIVAGQHAERGGWRYSPGVGADTSVTGWMMMALKSGQLAGLDVPTQSLAKIGRWLDSAQQSSTEPHLYRYNPDAPNTPEQKHGRASSKTMTAVGLLMRLYTGWKRDNPSMIRGAEYLAEHPPALGSVRDPQRDTYYWYYATQVMAHVGGDTWQAWNNKLHPLIVNSQVRQGSYAGSWDPASPLPDRWGPHAGRLYVTTMNLLSLEVQYRKLPLYEDTVK